MTMQVYTLDKGSYIIKLILVHNEFYCYKLSHEVLKINISFIIKITGKYNGGIQFVPEIFTEH